MYNFPSTADALPAYISPKNVELFTSHGIFTENEMRARYAIHLEAYNKIVAIEARTMMDMALHQILPAAVHYCRALCDTVGTKRHVGASCRAESRLIERLSEHTDGLYDAVEALRFAMDNVPKDVEAASRYYRNTVIPVMETVRTHADILETMTDKNYWPYPTYSDLLFY